MRTVFLIFLFLITLFGCSKEISKAPYKIYSAEFVNSNENIEIVEIYLDQLAKENKCNVFRKDRREISGITKGNPAFFTQLYYKENPILTVTNAGSGVKMHISILDYKNIPVEQLQSIVNNLNNYLLSKGIVTNLHEKQ